MRFALLIYNNEVAHEATIKAGPGNDVAEMAAYGALNDGLQAANALGGSEALMPVDTAKTVRLREGTAHVTDGPFAETHEQLGGIYFIDVADEAEALAWAARVPGAKDGSVEVRPVIDFSAFMN
jgi:hypothetical protein